MAPVNDEAIVLQTFPYSESSTILRLLTRSHGVRSVIAKGARRPRSRTGAAVEPFAEGSAKLYLKDGRGLQTLGGFTLTRSRQEIGRDLLRFGGAALLSEVVIRTGSEEAQPALFEHVRRTLDRVAAASPDELEAILLAESWSLIARLGFAPALESCLACSRAIDAEERTTFDYGAGGVRCGDCPPGDASRTLPVHARTALLAFRRGEAAAPERTAAHWQLVERFLTYHVLEGAPLRSLDFLLQALELS